MMHQNLSCKIVPATWPERETKKETRTRASESLLVWPAPMVSRPGVRPRKHSPFASSERKYSGFSSSSSEPSQIARSQSSDIIRIRLSYSGGATPEFHRLPSVQSFMFDLRVLYHAERFASTKTRSLMRIRKNGKTKIGAETQWKTGAKNAAGKSVCSSGRVRWDC